MRIASILACVVLMSSGAVAAELGPAGVAGPATSLGGAQATAPCVADETHLCLDGSRFRVSAVWTTTAPSSGGGQAVGLTDDTGYFWFFDSTNVEAVAKVVDGCSVNGHYWVFAAGLTNVQVVLTVTDTATGALVSYRNRQGNPFAPVQDTTAFACGAAPHRTAADATPAGAAPAAGAGAPREWKHERAAARAAGAPSACDPSDGTTLCLNADRFSVRALWETPTGSSGAGQAVSITSDTGYFWFFDASSVEVVVKVLDGCGVNQQFWVFAAGLTNVAVSLEVTDAITGLTRTYRNPQNTAFAPLQDTSALAACLPSCDSKSLTVQQVKQATQTSAQGLTDPFGADFNLLMNRFMALEGCSLAGSSAPQSAPRSAGPGCQYCGPGNSCDGQHGYLSLLIPSAELNAACAAHDSCYLTNCVPNGCYFDPSSRATPCDGPLFTTCAQVLPEALEDQCETTSDCFICSVASILNTLPTSTPKCQVAPCALESGSTCNSSTGLCSLGLPFEIKEIEGPFSGTWILNEGQYEAEWDNGAAAELTVQTFTPQSVVLHRTDTSDSTSAGMTAVYTGQLSADGYSIVNGSVTWTWPGVDGYPATGTWIAFFAPKPPAGIDATRRRAATFGTFGTSRMCAANAKH